MAGPLATPANRASGFARACLGRQPGCGTLLPARPSGTTAPACTSGTTVSVSPSGTTPPVRASGTNASKAGTLALGGRVTHGSR
jgi:hypothetical protein